MENGKKHVDLTEILGIAGVPTFLFIHAEGKEIYSYVHCQKFVLRDFCFLVKIMCDR